MQSLDVSVETTTGLERKLKFKIPNEQINKEVQTRLNDMGHKVQMKGFSAGRNVPFSIMKRRFGKQVRGEVIRELANTSLTKAIEQQNLKLAGILEIDYGANHQQQEQGVDTELVATLEVMPEIAIKDLKDIELEQIDSKVSEEDVAASLESISKRHTDWVEVDREARIGDRLEIDFVGKINNIEFKGGKHENYVLELGTKSLIEGFEAGLVGAKPGAQVELELTFPQDYHSKELAGKLAHFSIKVHKVIEAKIPELDDDFAKKVGIEEGGVTQLKQVILQNLQRELGRRIQNRNKEIVLNKLLESKPIDLPKTLIENEIKRMQEQFEQQLKQMQYQSRQHMPKISDDKLQDQARRRVNFALLILEYARSNDIKADPDKVEQKLATIAQAYEEPEKIIAWYKAHQEQMIEVESSVVEDQVIEKIIDEANVNIRTLSYNEIMNPQQAQQEER